MKYATTHRAAALADPTMHALVPEVGYVRARGPLPPGPVRGASCAAPGKPEDGSRHLLQPPGPLEPLFATWSAAAGAWLFVGGRRLGFTPEYLASHGWTYSRAAPMNGRRR